MALQNLLADHSLLQEVRLSSARFTQGAHKLLFPLLVAINEKVKLKAISG